jgi:putative phosphoesterase
MRIGILSDTHDHLKRTARAVAMLKAEGAEALIHCGDLTTPDIVYQCAELPSTFVLGNNDLTKPACGPRSNSSEASFSARGAR